MPPEKADAKTTAPRPRGQGFIMQLMNEKPVESDWATAVWPLVRFPASII